MAQDVVLLSGYDGLPEMSKTRAEKQLKQIVGKERSDPNYRVRFSPELADYCRRGYRRLNYKRILNLAKSGKVARREPPTQKTNEWRYVLRGISAGKTRRETMELVFAFEGKKMVVFITAYPFKKRGAHK